MLDRGFVALGRALRIGFFIVMAVMLVFAVMSGLQSSQVSGGAEQRWAPWLLVVMILVTSAMHWKRWHPAPSAWDRAWTAAYDAFHSPRPDEPLRGRAAALLLAFLAEERDLMSTVQALVQGPDADLLLGALQGLREADKDREAYLLDSAIETAVELQSAEPSGEWASLLARRVENLNQDWHARIGEEELAELASAFVPITEFELSE